MARRVALQEASTVSGEVFVPAVKALLCGTFIGRVLTGTVKAQQWGFGAFIANMLFLRVKAL